MKFLPPRVYPITDTVISGISHAMQTRLLVAGGARIVQLREKYSSPHSFYESALECVKIARNEGVKILINDRVDIALAVGADGVHLGQDDLPPEKAREILGEAAIIGFSTHSVGEAIEAMSMPIDYIAIGPIFPTHSKEKPGGVVGLEGLGDVRAAIGDFPLVAIGGIDANNMPSVFQAGADSAAMIGAILSDPNLIEEWMRQLHDSSVRSLWLIETEP